MIVSEQPTGPLMQPKRNILTPLLGSILQLRHDLRAEREEFRPNQAVPDSERSLSEETIHSRKVERQDQAKCELCVYGCGFAAW